MRKYGIQTGHKTMFPRGSILRLTPQRLALLRANGPRPLRPPAWEILTDAHWADLQHKFNLPEIDEGVAIRPFLEWTCIGLIDYRKETVARLRRKSGDDVIRWMSKASNIGKPLRQPIGDDTICRLSHIAESLNEAAGRIIIDPDEFTKHTVLIIPMQLCALVYCDLSGLFRRRKRRAVGGTLPDPIIAGARQSLCNL
jgi:hypothetical protein